MAAVSLPLRQEVLLFDDIKCGQDRAEVKLYAFTGGITVNEGRVNSTTGYCSIEKKIESGVEYYCSGGTSGNNVTCSRDAGSYICRGYFEDGEEVYPYPSCTLYTARS